MYGLNPKILIGLGLLIILVGLIWPYAGRYFHWLGRLPDDIRVEREGFRFYFPIASMIVLSIMVSLILKLIRWLGW